MCVVFSVSCFYVLVTFLLQNIYLQACNLHLHHLLPVLFIVCYDLGSLATEMYNFIFKTVLCSIYNSVCLLRRMNLKANGRTFTFPEKRLTFTSDRIFLYHQLPLCISYGVLGEDTI
jgi:hypothetical protein